MKPIKFLIAAAVVLSLLAPAAEAQAINFAPGVPIYPIVFYRDSVTINSGFAADSIFVSYCAPFKCNVVKVEVYMCTIDTGSAAQARTFALKKSNGTTLSTLTFASTSANVWSYDVASFPVRLNVGDIIRGIWNCGTGVRFKQVRITIWFVRV